MVNDARELTENIIDLLRQQQNPMPHPCTKLQICRRRHLEIIKHPKCSVAKWHSALRFLLNAVRRNLEFIDLFQHPVDSIRESTMEQIRVIRVIHEQQREMLYRKSRLAEYWIVSLRQPHVRPIGRGKAGRETEFGAKLTASLENGYSESDGFPERPTMKHPICKLSVNATKRNGHYPEAILTNKFFRNREKL